MTLREKLQADLKNAIRSGDNLQKSTLRMVISSVRMAELDKGRELNDAETIAILQKEVKSRQESIADARQAGREDLVNEAEEEIEVLQEYLPQPFTDAELEALAREAIAEAGAESPREMGSVMKLLMPRLEGRATGQEASRVVQKLLSS